MINGPGMKKFIILILAVLFINIAATAQWWEPWWPPDDLDPQRIPDRATPYITPSAFGRWKSGVGSLAHSFYAVPTLSTAGRYSAGMFNSDVDSLMDFNYYKPNLGNFVFLGGYPGNNSIDDTYYIAPDDYEISFGFGKTFENLYIGLYYGGSLFNSGGDSEVESSTQWANSIAVLVGRPEFGGIRLDLLLNTDARRGYYKTMEGKKRQNAPSFALTWGVPMLDIFVPYVTVGYKINDRYVYGVGPGPYQEAVLSYGSLLGVNTGVSLDVGASSALSGELGFRKLFKGKIEGSKNALPAFPDDFFGGNTFENEGDTFKLNTGGAYGVSVRASFKSSLDFGRVTAAVRPGLTFGYSNDNSGNVSGDSGLNQTNSLSVFEFYSQLNMGLRVLVVPRVYLFTGASLWLFDYKSAKYSAEYPGDTSLTEWDDWSFTGLRWSEYHWARQNKNGVNALGLGMTVTPVNNLVIGFGLNSLLDKIFLINLGKMRIEKGSFMVDDPDINIDLTVSYRF